MNRIRTNHFQFFKAFCSVNQNVSNLPQSTSFQIKVKKSYFRPTTIPFDDKTFAFADLSDFSHL